MSLGKKIGLTILLLLLLLVFWVYWRYFGFTQAQKYDRCARACEEIMISESNIPLCKMRCEEITGYNPRKAKKVQKAPAPLKPADQPKVIATPISEDDYYCAWGWPQTIIKRKSKEVVFQCPHERPWCNYADFKVENVGCCAKLSDDQKAKIDCVALPELQKAEPATTP